MKKILMLVLIPFICMKTVHAQGDSVVHEHRPIQFTFLFPPLSTNWIKNTQIVNDVSLNLLLGVSGGVEAFELGGLINIDKYYMRGVQLAGFGNNVGGWVKGAQLAGFFNYGGTSMNGFQGAGVINMAGRGMKGAQLAGITNVAGDSMQGIQIASLMNIAGKAKNSVQIAGFSNVADEGKTHFQASGFFNVAEEVEGVQLTGFMNAAGYVKGFQGAVFLNVCDSIDGVPLAFISVVRNNGYRRIGITTSELQYANLSFKLGVQNFYLIYSFGKPFGSSSRWMFGGGLGTEFDMSERSMFNLELTTHQELWIGNPDSPQYLHIDRLNLYNTLKFLYGWKIGKSLSFHLGPTFNVSVANTNPELGVLGWNQIPPYSFYEYTSSNYNQTNVQLWVGIQASIHF